jgi:hypothetical protein
MEYWRRRGFRRMSAPRRPNHARLIVVDFVGPLPLVNTTNSENLSVTNRDV